MFQKRALLHNKHVAPPPPKPRPMTPGIDVAAWTRFKMRIFRKVQYLSPCLGPRTFFSAAVHLNTASALRPLQMISLVETRVTSPVPSQDWKFHCCCQLSTEQWTIYVYIIKYIYICIYLGDLASIVLLISKYLLIQAVPALVLWMSTQHERGSR